MTDAAQTPSLPRGRFNLLAAIAASRATSGTPTDTLRMARRGCQCGPDRSCPQGIVVGSPLLHISRPSGGAGSSEHLSAPSHDNVPEIMSLPLPSCRPHDQRLVPLLGSCANGVGLYQQWEVTVSYPEGSYRDTAKLPSTEEIERGHVATAALPVDPPSGPIRAPRCQPSGPLRPTP